MSQHLLLSKIEWIEDASKFDEYFIKDYKAESDEG